MPAETGSYQSANMLRDISSVLTESSSRYQQIGLMVKALDRHVASHILFNLMMLALKSYKEESQMNLT